MDTVLQTEKHIAPTLPGLTPLNFPMYTAPSGFLEWRL